LQWIADILLILLSPAGLTAAAIFLAGLLFPRLLGRWFRKAERLFARGPLFCAIAALVICAIAGLVRMPVPIIHDEHSNLLLADTLAHGRLANPPHPHWKHFEDFHVLQHPTYASKFPPGTGAVLALGMLLGHPLFGMWLVIAAIAAAMCWALRAFLSRGWSVLGALIVVTHPLVFGWGMSYWGGAVALLGSALFLGGIARKNAWPAAIGLALLVCSRPYEGGALTIATAIVFHRELFRLLKPLTIACAAVLIPMALFLIFYNWRVTGDPRVLPYVLYEEQHNPAPLFVWEKPRPASVSNAPEMRRHYEVRLQRAQQQKTFDGWFSEAKKKVALIIDDLLTVPFAPLRWLPAFVLLALPLVLARQRDARGALVLTLLTFIAIFLIIWYIPYYLAVLFPPLTLLWLQCLRRVRISKPLWSRLIVMAWFVAFAVELVKWKDVPLMWQPAVRRARIERDLERQPGRDLVFVEYGPQHFVHVSWTYNRADIDGAEVVWARLLSPAENRRLIGYFRDRRVWIIRLH
jgi:hypothetical protein